MHSGPRIEVVLNREHPDAEETGKEIEAQLQQLKGLGYTKETAPLKPGALSTDLHEVVRYVIDHGDELAPVVITTLIEILRLVAGKRKDKAKKPVVILMVDARSLGFPSSDTTQRKFLAAPKRADRPKERPTGRGSKKRG